MITITDLYKRSRKVEAVNGLTLEPKIRNGIGWLRAVYEGEWPIAER